MDVVVTTAIGLLVVATIVALIARRLAFPYTVGLVVTGISLALTRSCTMGLLRPQYAGLASQ
jgi:Kef-type K+ transport system membrane component KefB